VTEPKEASYAGTGDKRRRSPVSLPGLEFATAIHLTKTDVLNKIYKTNVIFSSFNSGKFLKRKITFATTTTSRWQYSTIRERSFSL
jgi:hypothetical protein